MAVAFLLDFKNTGVEVYDAIINDLQLAGKTYRGGIFHQAGSFNGGVRVVDVWESQADFDAFFQEKLGAVLERHGIQPPQITSWPVHNYLDRTPEMSMQSAKVK